VLLLRTPIDWYLSRPTHTRVLLAAACVMLIVELSLRRFAPRSRVYAVWTAVFKAIGEVWTAVLLSLIYVLAVGPVGLVMRAGRKDSLDRDLSRGSSSWRDHSPNPLGAEAAARHQF
jgi:hypothetical protein